MDPQVPTQRALAIAGDRIAGGVGVHETALASPDVVDLGGRVVLPGFTDAHVHFPTWALSRSDVALDGCVSLEEALERIRAGGRPAGGVDPRLRVAERRLDGCRRADRGAARRGDRRDAGGDDREGLPLALAQLGRARARERRPRGRGGVVERDASGAPTGVLREEAAWRFKERHLSASGRRVRRGDAGRAQGRGLSRRDGGARQGRLARGAPSVAEARARRDADAPGVAVGARRPGRGAPCRRRVLGPREPFLRVGYLKAFMDGTLGSQTALMLDGSGVRITSGEELAEIVLAGAEAGFPVAVHAIGDGANREALDAFERTGRWEPLGLRHRVEHAQLCRRRPAPVRRARDRLLGAVLARSLRPRSRRALLGGSSTARTRTAP